MSDWQVKTGKTMRTVSTLLGVFFAALTVGDAASVSVAPASVALTAAQTQQFTATVTGTANTAVTWSLRPAVGTLSSSRLYGGPVPVLAITTSTLPDGTTGVAYNATVSAKGGIPPYTWSISSGQLPPSVSFGITSGLLSGIPAAAGVFNFTVQATDLRGIWTFKNLSVAVEAPLTITTTSLPSGVLRSSYNATLAASGGMPPVSWEVTTGRLPPGLVLSSSGSIAGTPVIAGSYSFAIQATDKAGHKAGRSYALPIASRPPSVSLTWAASTSLDVTGYNVYRGTKSGGPYTKLTSVPVAALGYTDNTVQSGYTYYYVVSAVDYNNNESDYSNQAQVVVPAP